MTKVTNRYHLHGFMLERYADGGLRWVTWLDLGDEGLLALAGPCVVHAEPDVIELGPCKLRDAADEHSMEEVQQLLTSRRASHPQGVDELHHDPARNGTDRNELLMV